MKSRFCGEDLLFVPAIKVGSFAVRVNFLERATCYVGGGFVDGRDEMLKHFWLNVVIGVYEGEILSGGFFNASIAGTRESLIFLSDGFDAGVFFGICVDDSF